MSHEVFISHSAKDSEVANRVCVALEAEGIKCWIAPRDVTPSAVWAEAITEAIEKCKVMVIIVSSNLTGASSQVTREIELAEGNTALLPFFVERVELSKALKFYLKNRHWLDASTPPLENHLPRLVETVEGLTGRREEFATEPIPTQRASETTPVSPPPETSPAERPARRDAATMGVPREDASHTWKGEAGGATRETHAAHASNPWKWIAAGAAALLIASVAIIAFTSSRGRDASTNQQNVANSTPAPPSATPAPSVAPTPRLPKTQIAAQKEREGFQHLIDGRFDEAVKAFEDAELAVPQYHSAFEIAGLLRRHSDDLANPEERREIFAEIVERYSGQAPRDLVARLKQLAATPSSSEPAAPPRVLTPNSAGGEPARTQSTPPVQRRAPAS